MQIVVRGDGPALVLLHGWAMHGGVFSPLLARLEQHFTLHLVDLPGHGLSKESEVALTLDDVAGEIVSRTPPAFWLGWSLGGLVALHAAQTRPRSVLGLIMLCASPRFVASNDWPHGMADTVFSGFAEQLAMDYAGTIEVFLLLEAHGSPHRREELLMLREQVFAHGAPSVKTLQTGLALLQDSDLRARLAMMATPSLWIAGRRDRLVSPQAMRAAADAAGGRFHLVDHGGHAPFLTFPDEVADAVSDFALRVPA